MGMTTISFATRSARRRGALAAVPSTATGGTRPISPLPPTLVLEGAAQPFRFEMVASQACQARPPKVIVMTSRMVHAKDPPATIGERPESMA
jgi:hypothetical protein